MVIRTTVVTRQVVPGWTWAGIQTVLLMPDRKVPGRRMWVLGVCVWVSVLGAGKGGKGGGKGVGAKGVGNLRERV